jgi:glyoxylase-like metal-dependent hydrolase (beta-lactamase superfamily II)
VVERATRQLANDLWLLDTFYQGQFGIIASYLLTGPSGAALIDVGSAATIDQLVASMRRAGVGPSDIRHVVLTHIHLDHAGAAGQLLRYAPQATVYVHPSGAPHLIDPSRLLQSAERIYGGRMRALWGDVAPIAPGRLHILADGEDVHVGGRTLRALYTPGHATHHIAYHDAERGEVFAGDVAGVRLEGINVVRPPTPPPDLLLEDWYASIERLLALQPRVLFLAHFGEVRDVREHLDVLRERLALWGDRMVQGLRRGLDEDGLTQELAALSMADLAAADAFSGDEDEDLRQRYELAANHRMSAQGYVRYYRKYHPELLTSERPPRMTRG